MCWGKKVKSICHSKATSKCSKHSKGLWGFGVWALKDFSHQSTQSTQRSTQASTRSSGLVWSLSCGVLVWGRVESSINFRFPCCFRIFSSRHSQPGQQDDFFWSKNLIEDIWRWFEACTSRLREKNITIFSKMVVCVHQNRHFLSLSHWSQAAFHNFFWCLSFARKTQVLFMTQLKTADIIDTGPLRPALVEPT